LLGGEGTYSGSIVCGDYLKRAVVHAGAEGGDGETSGSIVFASTRSLHLQGDLRGGAGQGSGSISAQAEGISIGTLQIDGSVVGGESGVTGIFAGGVIDTVAIRGDLSGTATAKVRIGVAGYRDDSVSRTRLTVGSLEIGGDVEYAEILAGDVSFFSPQYHPITIGKVHVQGDWIASTLAAAVEDSTGDGYGRNDGPLFTFGPALTSRIASVIIDGAATGSPETGDHFGITAGTIKQAFIHGARVPTTAGMDDILLDPSNGDFRLVEIEQQLTTGKSSNR
jgi:hypothetical protein